MTVDPLTFFDDLYCRYQTAINSVGGTIQRLYQIGGYIIKLEFAGVGLIPYLARAFSHLEIEPVSDPALTIYLWDSTSTNTLMIEPPWQIEDYRECGKIRGFITERFHTSWQWGSNALSIIDLERNLAIYWVNNCHQLPYWETGAPLRTILHIWFSNRNIQLVHAGAVGTSEGGVLLVGKGGSGKSTTALSCLQSSLSYASDDYALISLDPVPTVFSIYNTGKKNADDLDRLPFLDRATSNRDRLASEKALYFIHEHYPEKIISNFPLSAILLPKISGINITSIESISTAVALIAIAPSTIFQLPGAENKAFEFICNLVKKVKCYHLEMGTDIEQIPRSIVNLLSS